MPPADNTVSVSESTKIRLPLLLLFSLLAVTATATGAWYSQRSDTAEHARKIHEHEQVIQKNSARLDKLEDAQAEIAVIKNDVQWIRRELERRKP